MRRALVQCTAVICAAFLPLIYVLGKPSHFLADPLSELPVKLWGWETFGLGTGRFLGGTVDAISFPNPGPLNNPDLVGTLAMGVLAPVTGEAMAYNLLVCLLLAANGCAAWALARHLNSGGTGALVSGVGFALSPLALSYGMAGAITDLLNLWPYPLALMFTLQALRSEATGALGGWRHGLGAGVLLGLGFTTCVYNFVVFAPMALIGAAWLPVAWRRGLGPADTELPQPGLSPLLRRAGRIGAQIGLGFAVTGGLYAVFLLGIMDAESSQMSKDLVGSVRHSPPFQELSLAGQDRYVAHLVDYVRSGKDAAVLRDNASRFRWAFHPGWLIYGLSLVGLWAHRKRLSTVVLWPAMALFFALVSTGPFLIVGQALSLEGPNNLLWVGLFECFPGTAMLLEPFRYALVVSMALCIAAGLGAQALARTWGAWVPAVLAVGIVAETGMLSPVPIPPPTTAMTTPAAYTTLDETLPPGAIIELPYFHAGTGLFQRRHFLHQRSHRRPIPNPVFGLAPPVLVDNPLTFALLHEEQVPDRFLPRTQAPEGTLLSGARTLAGQGFGAIVVDPSKYSDRGTQKRIRRLLREAGHVQSHEGLWVISL